MGKKKAVLVGATYPGTEIELKGCCTDVSLMSVTLINRFGFDPDNIAILLDNSSNRLPPTGTNIRLALEWLIFEVQPGDVLLFHFSGHGMRLPLEDGKVDNTGYDECIVGCDLNILIDDDFREIVDRVPEGVLITFISDSCHSGGLIENEKEQIGDSTTIYKVELESTPGENNNTKDLLHWGKDKLKKKKKNKVKEKVQKYAHQQIGDGGCDYDQEDEHLQQLEYNGEGVARSKTLPVSTFVRLLRKKTRNDGIKVDNLRQALSDTFACESSSKVKNFARVVLGSHSRQERYGSKVGDSVMSIVGSLAEQFLKKKLDGSINKISNPTTTHVFAEVKSSDRAILMSGCQSHETSADAIIKGNPDISFGAFSNAIHMVLEQTEGSLTNRDLIVKVQEFLVQQGFTQHPGLYCSDNMVDRVFIC